jgi:hypothetical protein
MTAWLWLLVPAHPLSRPAAAIGDAKNAEDSTQRPLHHSDVR